MLPTDNFDFISLQVDYWDSPWQNRHGFLSELSKNYRVFFLSPPFYLADLINGRAYRKTNLYSLNLIKNNLYSYVPPRYLPYNYRFQRIDVFIRSIRNYKIQKNLKNLGFDKPILCIWHPDYVDMIGMFKESLVIYYKYDNYAGYIGGTGEISPKERELFDKADIVFVTAQGLYDLHKNDCREIHLIPNGVDYDLFSKSLTDEVKVPSELESIPRPRIGYVGVINEKVDFELLTHLCKLHPDWSIVMVGPEKVRLPQFKKNLEKLYKQKNCYFLGKKYISQVPSYIKGLDIAMMCYLVNDWTYYGYPLKMHEYLACGKPSVSADLPEVRPFSHVVKIAKSQDEWVSAIEGFLYKNDAEDVLKRLEVAKLNSWEERVNKMLSLIRDKFNKKRV